MNALNGKSGLKLDASNCASLPMSNWPAEVYPFEPIHGWFQRAAEVNYAFSTDSFLGVLGLNGVDWDFEEQLEIAHQLPIDGYEQLEWNTPKRIEGGYEICGHQLAARLFAKGARRVCPHCLADGRYVRVWFDIVPMAACPIHDVALIEGLENDPLDWRSTEFGRTRSGIAISPEHATHMAASELDLYIYAALSGTEASVPSHFAGQPLQAVIQAALSLGRLHKDVEGRTPTPREIRELSQLGFPSLFAGREAIVAFLTEANWLQSEYDKARYDARCHYAPQITRTIPSDTLRELISDCFGAARVRNGLATPSGKLSKHDGEDGCWTIESAASHLHLESKYLRKILAAASVSAQRCAHTRAFRLSSDNLESVERYVAASLPADAVAEELGCSIEDVDELVNRRTLEMDFRRDGQRYFQRSAIDAFCARAKEGRSHELDPKGMSLSSFAVKSEISLPEAYSQLIRDKSIGLLGCDDGLPFFLGAKVAYFRGTRIRPSSQIKDAITFAKAKARLGSGADGLKQLIELSYLKVVQDKGGRSRICEESLNAFENTYARAADYAPLLGCPARSALKELRKSGVEPINEYGKYSVSFVSKEEVLRLAGISFETDTGFQLCEALRDQLSATFAIESVPATASVITEPAIVVEATSRKWSFRIVRKPTFESYELIARFRLSNEGRRLRKILAASIEPDAIWPGAEVQKGDGEGFILVDAVAFDDPSGTQTAALIQRCVDRALQLHRLL